MKRSLPSVMQEISGFTLAFNLTPQRLFPKFSVSRKET